MEEKSNQNTPKNKSSKLKKTLGFLFVATLLVLFSAVIVSRYREAKIAKEDPNASDYYAFFLSNDQVYFGVLDGKTRDEIIISNIYYISAEGQSEGPSAPSDSQFQLVKLGSEIHGPTDKMYITRSQVLFYERLRNDSVVVKSIESN